MVKTRSGKRPVVQGGDREHSKRERDEIAIDERLRADEGLICEIPVGGKFLT